MGMTREEVWRELLGLVRGAQGDRARVPSQKTVGRWLDRWVEDGLMVTDHRGSSNTGRPPVIYRTSRALCPIGVSFSETIPEFFQRKGSVLDTENVCPKVPEASTTAEDTLAPPISSGVEAQPVSDTPKSVQNVNPVPEGDLEELRINDTHNRTTCARARARQPSSQVQFRHMDKGDPSPDGSRQRPFSGSTTTTPMGRPGALATWWQLSMSSGTSGRSRITSGMPSGSGTGHRVAAA